MEEKDKKEKLRERLNIRDLYIKRLPDRIYQEFRQYAQDEFCGDYGLCMKFLWDFYVGLMPSGTEHLEEEIMQLRADLDALKASIEQEKNKPKVKKMLSGKEIKIGS